MTAIRVVWQRGIQWVRRQPVLFGVVLLLLAFLVKPALGAGDRLLFATFPPSLDGHWVVTDWPEFELSLSTQSDKIEGVGHMSGLAFTLRGIGNARRANLVLTSTQGQEPTAVTLTTATRRTMHVTLTQQNGTPSTFEFVRR